MSIDELLHLGIFFLTAVSSFLILHLRGEIAYLSSCLKILNEPKKRKK